MKKYFLIIVVLFLIALPSCFKKEIKNFEVTEYGHTAEEKNLNKSTIKELDGDFKPCYYWELDEEKTTNVH